MVSLVRRQLGIGCIAPESAPVGEFLIILLRANFSAWVRCAVPCYVVWSGADENVRESGSFWHLAREDFGGSRHVRLMLPDAIFLDEAIANLDAMDATLADFGSSDHLDAVHALFRHAHSIKGGASAFGLEAVVEIMHSIESSLDVARTSGVRPDSFTVGLLRDAVDAARHLLAGDGACDRSLAHDIAAQLRRRSHRPLAPRGGNLRRITIRSAETDVVSAAVIGFFTDIAGLGELLSVDSGAGGEQVFVVRTMVRDDELVDLLAMHVERANVLIAAVPDDPVFGKAIASGRVAGEGTDGASVRIDVDALQRLVLLARKLSRAHAASGASGKGEERARWQKDLDVLCRGLEDLGRAPVSMLFGRIPQLLSRLSGQLGKQFELSVTGDDIRVDRAVLQRLADPLMHLVRNACDHGIEMAAQRMAAGKARAGQIGLSAWHEPGWVRISVRDDGAGLSREKLLNAARARAIPLPVGVDDQAVWQLVFAPGLSTAHTLSEVSGRGVGMDAVRRQVASIGGAVSITSSAGKGVCVTMSIPVDDMPELETVV